MKKISGLGNGLVLGYFLFALVSCKPDKTPDKVDPPGFKATPYNLVIPPFFPPMDIPSDNPLTVEGVHLGRYLFWEKKLSGNNTQSCGSCHLPQHGFSDPNTFSVGITGALGTRQAMPLINLGWDRSFFWDGRSPSLEDQVIHPVENPIEMDEDWNNALQELRNDPTYPPLFKAAFGSEEITKEKAAKAMASFLRTLISADSKLDRERRGQYTFNDQEAAGYNVFVLEGGDPEVVAGGQFGGDCFHCHSFGGLLLTDHMFHNNGLDPHFPTDAGRAAYTGSPLDSGKFKTPTLRNIELTAPYMHDGRFTNLEQVVEHYNSGGVFSSTIDPFMKYTTGGLQLSPENKAALIAFLKCLTDTSFINNPNFRDPH
jgi:cytochrome c peroxidase